MKKLKGFFCGGNNRNDVTSVVTVDITIFFLKIVQTEIIVVKLKLIFAKDSSYLSTPLSISDSVRLSGKTK